MLDGHAVGETADHAGRRADQRDRRTRGDAQLLGERRPAVPGHPLGVDRLEDEEGEGVLVLVLPQRESSEAPLHQGNGLLLAVGPIPMKGIRVRSNTALAGARTLVSYAVEDTAAKPAPSRISATYSASPKANGPTGLFPGGGVGGRGSMGRSAVPMCQGLRSTPCQQAKTTRPPPTSRPRMRSKAAVGSSKNMTPNWLTTRSNGPGSRVPVCTSSCTNSAGDPASAARRPRQVEERRGEVDAERLATRGHGLRQRDGEGPAATADVAHALTGLCGDVPQQERCDRLGETLTFRPRGRPAVVVPAPGLRFVGQGDTVPGGLASDRCASAW